MFGTDDEAEKAFPTFSVSLKNIEKFLISRGITVSISKQHDLAELLETAFDLGLMKIVDFYADENDLQCLSPLLFSRFQTMQPFSFIREITPICIQKHLS